MKLPKILRSRLPPSLGSYESKKIDEIMSKLNSGVSVDGINITGQDSTPDHNPPGDANARHELYITSWPLSTTIRKVKQETNKNGWFFSSKFEKKCTNPACAEEFDNIHVDQCPKCKSDLRTPDPNQLNTVKQVFAEPNPYYNFQALTQGLTHAGLLHDDYYIILMFGEVDVNGVKRRSPAELWEADPRFVKVLPRRGPDVKKFCPVCQDKFGTTPELPKEATRCDQCEGRAEIIGYSWNINRDSWGSEQFLTPEQVVHDHLFETTSTQYGTSPVDSIHIVLDIITSMDKFQWDAFNKGELQQLLLNFKNINEVQFKETMSKLRQKAKTNKHALPAVTTKDDIQVVKLRDSMHDMAATEFYHTYMQIVAFHFGISPSFLGIQTPGRLGSQDDILETSFDTIETIQNQIAESINKMIRQHWPEVEDWVWKFHSPIRLNRLREAEIDAMFARALLAHFKAGATIRTNEMGQHIVHYEGAPPFNMNDQPLPRTTDEAQEIISRLRDEAETNLLLDPSDQASR